MALPHSHLLEVPSYENAILQDQSVSLRDSSTKLKSKFENYMGNDTEIAVGS